VRVDKYLVENGYFESRNRALDAIKGGKVKVAGRVIKPSFKMAIGTKVEVEDEKFYISRAGRKLDAFLANYNIDMEEKRALDIGSSTGGFAQILLECGVGSLVCVDVGRDQLHSSLRDDSRVTLHEEMDIRNFESSSSFETISCDVSFISILMVTDDIDRLSQSGTDIVILYKPQFEVGKDIRRDSKGVVVDLDAIEKKKEIFELHCKDLGWKLEYQSPSKVVGKSGNQEYIYHFVKS
jgi:23S rRNA (cytidine1920-2'-O)/16S rRNA (cytidine1409-2'-O)-methyltransferase